MLDFISNWKDKIAHYVDVRIRLVKLEVIERTSNVLSYLIFIFIALFTGAAILIFAGMALSEYFAGLVDSTAGGYGITTGLYILLLLLFFALRKTIIAAFMSIFVKVLTDANDDDDDENDDDDSKPSGKEQKHIKED